MLNAAARERYLRHILLKEIGAQGQQKLLAARVVVIGAGGLGAPVIQYLAAAGVGRIDIVDDDAVALSNLQRQVIFADDDIGRGKAGAAAARGREINPSIEIAPQPEKLTASNARRLIDGATIVVEGVDNFAARYAANDASIALRVPLVSAAIGRFEGQVSTFRPWAGDLPCYRCLVPEAPPRAAMLTCEEEGVVGPLAGVIGSMAALETVKEIVGFGDRLAGRLVIYDGLAQRMRNIRLPRDPACVACGGLARD